VFALRAGLVIGVGQAASGDGADLRLLVRRPLLDGVLLREPSPEHHHKLPNLWVPLLSWRANPASLGLFALMLVFVLISWERISAILVGLFLAGSGIGGLSDLLSVGAVRQHTDFVLAYLAFGGVLALMVFSLSVVSLPMLLHRKVDFATALVTSFMATRLNFR
jgi:uncharacterized membrane protein